MRSCEKNYFSDNSRRGGTPCPPCSNLGQGGPQNAVPQPFSTLTLTLCPHGARELAMSLSDNPSPTRSGREGQGEGVLNDYGATTSQNEKCKVKMAKYGNPHFFNVHSDFFIFISAILLIMAAVVLTGGAAQAQVCATVKIEIAQELALERIAFDGRLIITNNLPDQPLVNLSVTLNIMSETGEDASQLFFTKLLSLNKIDAVDGTGTIPPQVGAEIHWMFIPSPGAGGSNPLGKKYLIGGEIKFTANDVPQSISMVPDTITVKPQPELVLDYFLPRDVWADDPFTDPVEAPIPFTLGVRTKNVGYGPAINLSITSAQPKIVENKQGLLIDFRLLGSAVNDQPVSPSLNLNMGNIQQQSCSTGRWEMITTLSGRFVEFKASYTHASELGGTLTSVINEVNTHFLTHEVLVDTPGSDNIRDYLAYTDPAGSRMPETIYTSNCQELPVNVVLGVPAGNPTAANPEVILNTDTLSGWVYAKVEDPAGGRLKIQAVNRSDGKKVNLNNAWVSEEKPTSKQYDPSVFYLNLLDLDTTGSYTITYETPPVDNEPPATTLVVGEPSSPDDGLVYVTSETNFLFTSVDKISGVSSMVFNLDNTSEQPAFPFTLSRLILPGEQLEGPHTITYYSIDKSGNRETVKTINIFVDDGGPVVSLFEARPNSITPSPLNRDPLTNQTTIFVKVTDTSGLIDGKFEFAAGSAMNDADFNALAVVYSAQKGLMSDLEETLSWNGQNGAGNIIPPGTYSIRLTTTDRLGHQTSAFTRVTVNELLAVAPLSPTGSNQMYPAMAITTVVWQDLRNGNWDIYLYDISASTQINLTEGNPDNQERPDTDGRYVVWQDQSSGNWNIQLHDRQAGVTRAIAPSPNSQTNPAVAAPWVVYQETNGTTNEEILAYNIDTGSLIKVTDNTMPQINPAISGDWVVWEDYRHGLGEIYAYNLKTSVTKRITDTIDNQTSPTISGNRIVWVDARDGNRNLYTYDLLRAREKQLTFTDTDEGQPFIYGNWLVYTDYGSGLDNPNLTLTDVITGSSYPILTNPNRQEWPVISGNMMVWQDNRSGYWQIYMYDLPLPNLVSYSVDTELNVVGVTRALVTRHGNAFELMKSWKQEFNLKSVYTYDYTNGELLKALINEAGEPEGMNFDLSENGALFVYANGTGDLKLDDAPQCSPLNLKAGFNLVSYACVPEKYQVSDLIASLGKERIVNISRFDNVSARWVSAGVRNGQVVGETFPIQPGEGYIIYTTSEIAGWTP